MYKFTQVEDQSKIALPLTRDTETLYYNTFLVLDANVLTEPRVWQISKVNRSNSKGIAVFTCTQELANTHSLKADYDSEGNVIAWWADWKDSNVEPTQAVDYSYGDVEKEKTTSLEPEPIVPEVTSKITCTGRPQMKVGGSAKTFTVNYFNIDNEDITEGYEVGEWTVSIDGEILAEDLVLLTEVSGAPNKMKIKFLGDDFYIGKVMTVTNTSGEVTSSLDIEILPL